MVNQLPTVYIKGQKYYVDDCLKEYRKADNPRVRIPFSQTRITNPKNQLKRPVGVI